MLFGFKDSDGIYKPLINNQKQLKSLYQQLILKGYTDTEEEFLSKVLKIVEGIERQEIDSLITSLTNNLDNTNKILSNVKTKSEENSANIRTNVKNINDINNYNKNLYNKLSDTFEDINSRLDSITNDLNNELPYNGSEGEVLLKGKDKNNWTDLFEIPISLSDFSEENEILGLFQIQKQEFKLGTILNDNHEIKIYIDGVLQDLNKIYENNNGDLIFFKGASLSTEIIDVEIFGNRETDIIEYDREFLKKVKYAEKILFNYDPYKGSIETSRAFFSNNSYLNEVNNIIIGENAISESSKGIFSGCKNLQTAKNIDIGDCTNLDMLFYLCTKLVSFSIKDTSKVSDMTFMFNRCTSLTKIEGLDVSKVTRADDMFSYCNALSYIKLVSSDIDSLQLVINKLPKHEGARVNAYVIDLRDCKIDVSTITAPAGWTIKTT